MTRHSASRDVLYSTPPGPDEETTAGDSEAAGSAAATEEHRDETRDETPAPSAADD